MRVIVRRMSSDIKGYAVFIGKNKESTMQNLTASEAKFQRKKLLSRFSSSKHS